MTSDAETPFPVTWDDPKDAETCWMYDNEHTPGAVSQLGFELGIGPFIEGFGWGMSPTHKNYYMFYAVRPRPAEEGAQPPPPQKPAPDRLRDARRRWDEEILPEVLDHITRFRETDFDTLPDEALAAELEALATLRFRAGRLHTLSVTPPWEGNRLLIDTYKELTGRDDELAALRLIQGDGNKSVEAGEALWRVSRVAADIPAARERLLAVDARSAADCLDELESLPEAAPFVEAFRAYLEEFGWRSGGELAVPTWAEDPSTPIAMLRAYLEAEDYDPVAQQRRLAEERDAAMRDTLASLDADAQHRLEDAVDAARAVARLTEDHNYYIDQRLYSLPRRLILAAGRRLAAHGALEDPSDVFFLRLPELLAALRGDAKPTLRETASERKEELAHWRTVKPPRYIGAPPPEGASTGSAPQPAAESSGELHGTGVSAGVARGAARIVRTLEESDRLRPGDVLVTSVTQPAWTPLFTVAGAIVTEVGGMLSHTAIAAREYGIPAVVAVADAMRRLKDGQLVEVDGSAGTVRVVG